MKNQHQADGKNNRAAQSKQSRKTTGAKSATSAVKPFVPVAASEEHLDRLTTAINRLRNTHDLASGLFFLLTSHFEKDATGTRESTKPSESEACGIMLLGDVVTGGISDAQAEMNAVLQELGRADLARVRLAKMDAQRAVEKGGAR